MPWTVFPFKVPVCLYRLRLSYMDYSNNRVIRSCYSAGVLTSRISVTRYALRFLSSREWEGVCECPYCSKSTGARHTAGRRFFALNYRLCPFLLGLAGSTIVASLPLVLLPYGSISGHGRQTLKRVSIAARRRFKFIQSCPIQIPGFPGCWQYAQFTGPVYFHFGLNHP